MPRLVDLDGKPLRAETLAAPLPHAAQPAVSLRAALPGQPADELPPARLARLLRDAEYGAHAEYLELAEDMEDRDLHYRGELSKRKAAVAGLPWSISPADDSPQAAADAALAARVLRSASGMQPDGQMVTLRGVFLDLLDGIGKGISINGVTWDTTRAPWVPRVAWVDPRLFDSGVSGYDWSYAGPNGRIRLTDLPFRYVVHTPKLKSGLPIRAGLARVCAWAYAWKHYSLSDWAVFLGAYGFPLRLGKYPFGAHPDDVQVLKNAVRSLGSDAAAVIPEDMAIEFINSASKPTAELWEAMARYQDRQISVAVVGQTSSADSSSGSMALAAVQAEVRYDILEDDAAQLGELISATLVRWIVQLNAGPRAAYPIFAFQVPEAEDLKALAEQLPALADCGVEIPTAWVRSKWGIPKREGDEPILSRAAAPQPDTGATQQSTAARKTPRKTAQAGAHARADGGAASTLRESGSSASRACPGCGLAAHAGEGAAADWIDGLVGEALADWQPQIDPVVAPILAAGARAGSYEAFLAELPRVLAEMSTDTLVASGARFGLAARAKGDMGDGD